jgi:hypothetical protein
MPVARPEILPAAERIFAGRDFPYDNWNIFIFGRMPRLSNRKFVCAHAREIPEDGKIDPLDLRRTQF